LRVEPAERRKINRIPNRHDIHPVGQLGKNTMILMCKLIVGLLAVLGLNLLILYAS